jgi:hypothetical protein
MSYDRQFERDAQAWLELGPSTAPTRAVDSALLTIQKTPQQRDLRGPWRFPHLTIQFRFAVAAAVGLLAIGGLLILRNPQSQIGHPVPSPTTVESPSPSPVSAAALQATWASIGRRPMPGVLDNPIAFSIDSAILRIPQWHVDVDSTWSLVDNGSHLLLNFQATFEGLDSHLTGQRWDCQIGDEGIYSFNLSEDGATLTLNPVTDPCAPRTALLAGGWTRWACPDPFDCRVVSEQSPGRHVAPIFKPFDTSGGQFAYTLPAGWGTVSVPPSWPQTEWPTEVNLGKLDAPDQSAVDVYSRVDVRSSDPIPDSDPIECRTSAPDAGATPADVAAWLSAVDGLEVSPATPVTIGGLSGVMVDLSLTAGWTNQCETSQVNGGPPTYDAPRYLFFDPVTVSNEGLDVIVDDRARYILLDGGAGQTLLIRVQTPGQAAFDALIADVMPVIESFEFIPD